MENLNLPHKERSTALIAIVTNPEQSREFERGLTVKKIIKDAVPMVELKRVVGTRQVAIALDVQLTRLVASLNLKWNLNDLQIKTIVEDLIDKFPNESLEDFILCFKKARQGEYGELIRLDSPIVFTWMEKYLEEKYTEVENQLMAEKETYNKTIQPENSERDWLKVWQEAIDALPSRKPPPITDEEINKEGQLKTKRQPYPQTSPEEFYLKQRRLAYIKHAYEPRTAELRPGAMSETDFNLKYDQENL